MNSPTAIHFSTICQPSQRALTYSVKMLLLIISSPNSSANDAASVLLPLPVFPINAMFNIMNKYNLLDLKNTNILGKYFDKMLSEFLRDINWQWWVSQALATVSIIFCITAMQQKKTTGMLWHRTIYSLIIFGGGCFLGKLPVMIMLGVAFLRNAILLGISYKADISKKIKWSVFAVLAVSLIALNIVFWENLLSILSIAVGLAFLTAFIQSKPVNVRRISIAAASISIVFYALAFSPVNAIINVAVLISSIIALVRFDRKKIQYKIQEYSYSLNDKVVPQTKKLIDN